ncbi:site-2 protease family protein [Microaerobacter geothermalis]|uniref:site-2 protease family protein n=1 Tax=Microaerobacter geothermalis TaxID=674972 RepID=UPI001F42F909|nr:site-2 protease family protein [Microaerobacter geothermalis]MCF6094377.1 site-2 protease family protein [Microaerobacter geothermalis]
MEYKEYQQDRKQEKNRKKWGKLGGIGTILIIVGGKLKILLPLLKLLKLGKIGGTLWSMLLMIGAYALIYPWSFAIGIVIMLLIHEMGHVLAAKRKGLPVSAPAFIPFLGALITMKERPNNAETEAFVALGGPLIGGIGASFALLLGFITGYTPLYMIAWIGFFLNLLNLLPIHPLDGGRIVTAISRWLWLVGLVGGLLVILYLRAFIFLFFWILFAWELYQTYIRRRKEPREGTASITVSRRLFEENHVPIPGEMHSRRLDYRQYCRIEDRTVIVEVYYPVLGFVGSFSFPNGTLLDCSLSGTQTDDEENVILHLKFRYYPQNEGQITKEEAYYQVPKRVRFFYGVAYFGLAFLLGALMVVTSQITITPAL